MSAWTDLLPRIRTVDLGAGAPFGQRMVAKVEGVEVCRSRPSDGGLPVEHFAAALLHVLGATAETPTWEIREMLTRSGLGPPYGRGGAATDALRAAARELLAATPLPSPPAS